MGFAFICRLNLAYVVVFAFSILPINQAIGSEVFSDNVLLSQSYDNFELNDPERYEETKRKKRKKVRKRVEKAERRLEKVRS